jgi:hypothetical protein
LLLLPKSLSVVFVLHRLYESIKIWVLKAVTRTFCGFLGALGDEIAKEVGFEA